MTPCLAGSEEPSHSVPHFTGGQTEAQREDLLKCEVVGPH